MTRWPYAREAAPPNPNPNPNPDPNPCVCRCAFALEYIVGVHERRSLRTPRAALAALAPYDAVLAAQVAW